MSSPCVGRRVSPPINLLKEKEWDPWKKACHDCGGCFHGQAWNRRSALESACGSPSVRRSQVWDGDLNRPRAKAISQMIMGMIDVRINNNQQASMDEDLDDGVHGVWAML